MKKPKFNIGDKLRGTITKTVDGILMTGQVEWYVSAIYIDVSPCPYRCRYRLEKELTSESPCKYFDEEDLVLVEEAQYEDE